MNFKYFFDRNKILDDEDKKETYWKKVVNILLCNKIRIAYLIQISFCIYYLIISHYLNYYFCFLSIFGLVIIIDAIYLSIFRLGKEYTWFSITIFSYSIVILTTLWRLVLIKLSLNEHECLSNNTEFKEQMKNYRILVKIQINSVFIFKIIINNKFI